MKWIVYALLAVNLGLLTWNLQTQGSSRPTPLPAAPTEPPATDANAPTLPLLTELGKDSLRGRTTAGVDSAAPQTRSPAEATSAPVGAGLPANPPSDSPTPPTTTPDPPPPLPPASAEAPGRTCLTLGPLDDTAPLSEIQTWLEQRGATVDLRTDERREVSLYWIYFPPAGTRNEAVAQVERMRQEGISDIIVVPKGDMVNAISLGLFSRPDTRDRRLRELNAKGYQPSISPRYRTTLATWVDVSVPEDVISDAEVQQRWPELGLARKPCTSAQIAANAPASYNPGEPPRTARRFLFSGQAPGQPPAGGPGTR